MKPYWSCGDCIKPVVLTGEVDFMCGCIHGLSRSCTMANTIIHGHGTRVSFLKVLKIIQLSRIHSNGPSVTRIRPRLVRLYVRFTRMTNHISRMFCLSHRL